MPQNTTSDRPATPGETAVSRVLATMRAAVKVPLVLAAVALPIALATPASAATESAGAVTASASAAPSTAGCTLKVLKPSAAGTDIFTGQKRVSYKVTVKCPAFIPVYVQVQQKWYERDASGDQLIGSRTSFQAMPLGGDHTFSVDDDLPDTEAGPEEMVQKARFFAVNQLPVPAGVSYGPWVYSGVSSL
jgi:hypothetical protein